MPHIMIKPYVYPSFMSHIAFILLQSTFVLSFQIDAVFALSLRSFLAKSVAPCIPVSQEMLSR